MGWGRTLFLGDIGNRMDIEDTERDIQQLKQKLANAQYNRASQDQMINQLIMENAQTKLYLASIVRLMLSKGSITKQELEAMVDAIDAEDGKSDGMFNGKNEYFQYSPAQTCLSELKKSGFDLLNTDRYADWMGM